MTQRVTPIRVPSPPAFIDRRLRMDTILLLIGMLAGLVTAVYQGGRIEASLEAGVKSEAEARQSDVRAIVTQLDRQGQDIRDIRQFLLSGKGGGAP